MIAIPCAELAYATFWQRLLTLKHIGWHIDQGLLVSVNHAYIQDAHNKIVDDVLKGPGWSRLLWLEHDHYFPTDLLEHVAHYTEPVVSGMYFSRNVEQPTPVVYKWTNEERTAMESYQPWEISDMLKNPGLHKVGVVPMGCTSIRRDVLEEWPKETPCYAVSTARAKDGGIMGDDVWFCRNAQEQGRDVYVDSRLQIAHLTLVPINVSLYDAWVGKMKREGKAKVAV